MLYNKQRFAGSSFVSAFALAARILEESGDSHPIIALSYLAGRPAPHELSDEDWASFKSILDLVSWRTDPADPDCPVRSWRDHRWLNKDGVTWDASFNENTGVWRQPVAVALADKYFGYPAEVPKKSDAATPGNKGELGEAIGQTKAALNALGEALNVKADP